MPHKCKVVIFVHMSKLYLNLYKTTSTIIIAVLCALLSVFSGCAATRTSIQNSTITIQGDRDNIWQISQAELKDRGFSLDRVDLRSGVIDTFPMVSKQWFEFWRRDVIGPKAIAESSLHTIRRYIKLQLTEQEKDKFDLHCDVIVQRFTAEPGLTSATLSGQDILSATRRQQKKSSKYQWIPIGSDNALANDILTAIKTQASIKQENNNNE